MKRVLAIAAIAIRNAVRSRIVLMLIAALLAACIFIPLTVKGDGTLAGQLQIMLRYSLGAVALLLALATVWAGCGAISLEIQHRRIHLVAVKPVRRGEIWFGHWLGLLILNAVLLNIMGVLNYGLIRWRLINAVGKSAQDLQRVRNVLTAKQMIYAPPPDVEADVQRELQSMESQGRLAPDIPRHQYAKAIRDRLRQRVSSAAPGATHIWRFHAPPLAPCDEPAVLRFQFSPSDLTFEKIRGVWRIRRESGETAFQIEREMAPFNQHTLEVPAWAVIGSGDILVEFQNTHERPMTVFFDPDHGVVLLLPSGTFVANYLRALLLIGSHLMFLAALSIAMGTLFSMPVSSFAVWCLILVFAMAGYIQNFSEDNAASAIRSNAPLGQRMLQIGRQAVFFVIQKIMTPVKGPDPLDLLAEGILIEPWWVFRVFAVKIVLYSGLLSLFSIWIFNRRELALPAI